MEDYKETFEKKVQKTQEDRNKQLEDRHKRLLELKQKNQEITEEVIKNLNKEELKWKSNF